MNYGTAQERATWAEMLRADETGQEEPAEEALRSTLLHRVVEEHVAALASDEYLAPQLRLRWRGDAAGGAGVDDSVALEDLLGVGDRILAEVSSSARMTPPPPGMVWTKHLKMCINSATRAAEAAAEAGGGGGNPTTFAAGSSGGGGGGGGGGGDAFGGASAATASMTMSFNAVAGTPGGMFSGAGGAFQ